jgi:D-3-phosphoglycerate dehydrogenase
LTTKKFEILVLNQISQVGLKRFPEKGYKVFKDAAHPDAILVRSYDMNAMKIPESVRESDAPARARTISR